MGLFDHFFRVDEEESSDAKVALEEAGWMVSFADHPQYPKFIVWLEEEADKAIDVRADAQTMIAGIARQNTLKEVRNKLRRDLERASATIERVREERHA